MFAQESVMGIKKEREAFERLPLAELAIESEFVFYNEETNSYWPNEDFCPSDAAETMNFAWEAWQAAKAHEAEKLKGCVLVPVQCPDPDFADSLFDELSKKAIGEFGDDLLIHFSDIDEEKIWALMVEAAKAQAVLEIQQSQQAEIDDLKAQLKAVHERRADFVEYCRMIESGNFVIVDKTDLELAIDALKDASNNDDDSFAHRAKDLEKALKNG